MAKSPKKALIEAGREPEYKSAQYWEDEKKRAWFARAADVVRQRIKAGKLDPADERAAKSQIADLIKQYAAEEASQAGAAEMGRLANLPGSEPEPIDVPDVRPLSQREREEQQFALATAKTHGARERERELAAVQAAEQPDLPSAAPSHPEGDRLDRRPGEDILDIARQPVSRPGWTTKIRARVDRETGKIDPRHFMYLPQGSKSMEVMSGDVQKKLERLLNHPQYGRLLAMMHLRSNPNYVVQIYKGERGPVAMGFKMARGEKPQKIASGELINVQKTMEDAAGVLKPDEASAPGFHFGATKAPEFQPPSADGPKPPEGGWQEFDSDLVNDVTFADDDPTKEPIAWGDFWRSKSPEEIAALPIDPREIDPKMAEDPALDDDQRKALIAKISASRKPAASDRERKHFVPRPDMTGQKTVDVIDPRTGKKYREKITVTDTPALPAGYDIPKELADKRDAIMSVVPQIKDVIDKLGHEAKIKIKKTDDMVGFRAAPAFAGVSGVETDVSPDPGEASEIDPNEKCGKCGHESSYHSAGLYSCQHPDDQVEKEFRGGRKMKVSTCPHFVFTGKKTRKGRLEQTWDADTAKEFVDELSSLPSSWDDSEKNKRIMDIVGALDTYLDAIRKGAWGKLRQDMVKEFAGALFGKDAVENGDPKIASIARSLADQTVFGTRGAGPDWDDNKRMAFATSRSTPGNWHRQAEQIAQIKQARGEALSLYDRAIMRLAQWPEKGKGNLYDIAAGMRQKYDEASKDLQNEIWPSEDAMILVKRLARDIRASAGKGKEADKAMGLEKAGQTVRWSHDPKVRKKGKKGASFASIGKPTPPTITRGGAPQPEAEAEADAAAARAEKFKGVPKSRGPERAYPEVVRTSLPGATPVPAGQQFRRDDQMMGDDPVARRRRAEDERMAKLKPSVRAQIKGEQLKFDNWLNRIMEVATADYSPSWFDDIE
jgi:hypothetical protein